MTLPGDHLVETGTGSSSSREKPTTGGVREPARIYVFSNVVGGGDGIAYAMAEDGAVLGSHYCSHEGYARHDLGVIPGSRPDRHEHYAKHYPDGYQMVFVPASEVAAHPGLAAAWKLNQERAARAAADTSHAEELPGGPKPNPHETNEGKR